MTKLFKLIITYLFFISSLVQAEIIAEPAKEILGIVNPDIA